MKAKATSAKRVELGEYIVADPEICHEKATFNGTRIMISQVLEQVASGTPWERIVWSWRGKVSMQAITEAVQLASEILKEAFIPPRHVRHRREHLRNRCLEAA